MNALIMLLQVDGSEFITRLADQGLALGLLGVAAYIFWRQLRAVQDKLEKYMEEDRKELFRIIEQNTTALQSNTKVMERIEDNLEKRAM